MTDAKNSPSTSFPELSKNGTITVSLYKTMFEPETQPPLNDTSTGAIWLTNCIDIVLSSAINVSDIEANQVTMVSSVDNSNRYVNEFPITAGFNESVYS